MVNNVDLHPATYVRKEHPTHYSQESRKEGQDRKQEENDRGTTIPYDTMPEERKKKRRKKKKTGKQSRNQQQQQHNAVGRGNDGSRPV